MALTSSIIGYDPHWPQRYEETAAALAPIFGAALVEMHHVGSTAVPELAAKPEIDILAVVNTPDTPASWTAKFAELGYRRGGDLSCGHRFFKRDVDGVRTHKVHVCSVGHHSIGRMLSFRDHLRSHPVDRVAYENFKLQLERENVGGIAEYLAQKRPYIDEVMARISAGG